VVDLGIGARRLRRVLAQEAVLDPAGQPARERPRQRRRGVRAPRLTRCGAEVAASGQRQGTRSRAGRPARRPRRTAAIRAAGGDPARRHERDVDRGADELQQREDARLVALVVVGEGAAVAAGLEALDDERVGAGRDGRARLAGGRDRDPDGAAVALQPRDDVAVRVAEGERDDVGALGPSTSSLPARSSSSERGVPDRRPPGAGRPRSPPRTARRRRPGPVAPGRRRR
jgi:hypothetical protein